MVRKYRYHFNSLVFLMGLYILSLVLRVEMQQIQTVLLVMEKYNHQQ